MGTEKTLTIQAPPRRESLPPMPAGVRRTRPRDYTEWKTLRRWGKLPPWEGVFPGYLLREARESAGLTQQEMAERLGCTQQAVAQAERPLSNPTVVLLQAWADAVGGRLQISLEKPAPREATVPDPATGTPSPRSPAAAPAGARRPPR